MTLKVPVTATPTQSGLATWIRKAADAINQIINTAVAAGGTATWGWITGTLSNQTDLQTALDAKVPTTRTISTTAPLSGGGDLSANRTLSITGSALTKADDTNVTLTLGGSASTALLAATSVTVNWSGQLAVARGGTGAATAAGARASLLPSFTGHAGEVLKVNTGETDTEWGLGPQYVPAVTGAEPPVLLSDGAGGLIFVAWEP